MFSKAAVLCLLSVSAFNAVDAAQNNLRGMEAIVPESHRRLERKCVGGMWVEQSDESRIQLIGGTRNANGDVSTLSSDRGGRAPRGSTGGPQRVSARVGPATPAAPATPATPARPAAPARAAAPARPPPRGGRPPRALEDQHRRLEEAECVDDDVMTRSSQPGAKGDPHFKTHGGEMYDFHGGCDLVLMDSPTFWNNLGLLVHIRTKISTWWSYVESSVVRIGDTTLEIAGSSDEHWFYINGEPIAPLEDEDWHKMDFDGFHIRMQKLGTNHQVKVYVEGSGRAEEAVNMRTYQDFVKVEVRPDMEFQDSAGLLGAYPSGDRVGRDGAIIENVIEFGQHWQVKPEEPKLFHTYDLDWIVPADQQCAMPVETMEKTQMRQRRLAESGLTMEMIEQACDHLEYIEDFDACVADVVATQDIEMASGGVW